MHSQLPRFLVIRFLLGHTQEHILHAEDSTKLASVNNYTWLVCMIGRRSLTVAWFKCPYTNKVRGGRHSVLESISAWSTIILNYAKYVHKCKYYLHELRSVSNVGSVTYLHCVNHDQLMVFSTQIPLFAHSSKHEVLSRNTQSNNQSQATTLRALCQLLVQFIIFCKV